VPLPILRACLSAWVSDNLTVALLFVVVDPFWELDSVQLRPKGLSGNRGVCHVYCESASGCVCTLGREEWAGVFDAE
jgi:hypothetical protein